MLRLRHRGAGMARPRPPRPLHRAGTAAGGQRPAFRCGAGAGHRAHEPVCADLRALSGRARAVLTCVRAIRPISRMGPRAKTQPTPLPGTRTPAHWTMCAGCAFRLLKDGGRFALCHRPERLAEVLAVLRAHRLEPKRLAFVKTRRTARHGSSLWKRRRTAKPACGWSRMC